MSLSVAALDLERRLRVALAGTHEREPRRLVQLDLSEEAERILAPDFLNGLRPAAVLAPIVRREGDLWMLLTVRSDTLSSHRGQVSFPGGRRDPEDPSAAFTALRETEEEIGLPPSRIELVGYLDDYPTGSNYRVTPVVGLIDGPVVPVTVAAEVAEVFEVPLDLLMHSASYARKTFTRDGLVLPYYEVHWNGYRIWGATAGMLLDLCRKVERIS